jgi:hypothetical protein
LLTILLVVTNDGDGRSADPGGAAELRIGTPERQAAVEALDAHLVARRLDTAEYERRSEACDRARTQAELLRIFADLPAPHPQLPPPVGQDAGQAAGAEENGPPFTPGTFTGCVTLGLGLPIAVILGFAYGDWWVLAVPVIASALMAYVEHLRTRPPRHTSNNNQPPG